jgi:hypothetical protein
VLGGHRQPLQHRVGERVQLRAPRLRLHLRHPQARLKLRGSRETFVASIARRCAGLYRAMALHESMMMMMLMSYAASQRRGGERGELRDGQCQRTSRLYSSTSADCGCSCDASRESSVRSASTCGPQCASGTLVSAHSSYRHTRNEQPQAREPPRPPSRSTSSRGEGQRQQRSKRQCDETHTRARTRDYRWARYPPAWPSPRPYPQDEEVLRERWMLFVRAAREQAAKSNVNLLHCSTVSSEL